MREKQHVKGKSKGKIMLYALSTCVWCRKTKKLLDSLGVEYDYVDMDQLEDDIRSEFDRELENWNKNTSFPTLVINDNKCIVGFEEEKIRQELE